MHNSTDSRTSHKPAKPYKDFPLFPHATKRWAKKIRGKLHYFGPWSDPDGALKKYLDQRDALHAGRKPRPGADELTIRDLLNEFLTSKRHLVDTRELTERTFQDYYRTCEGIADAFGKTRAVSDLSQADFKALRNRLSKRLGPVALTNEIQRIRSVFKYAYDAELIEKPLRYGPDFKRPSKKTIRLARNEKGVQMFEATEIRAMLDRAGVQLRAMILLAVNAGFGNADCGGLPIAALDLAGGWVNFPRPKTGVKRRCPLWPQTLAALQAVLADRPTPKRDEYAGLVFITKYGGAWHKEKEDNPVSKETRKLLDSLGINGSRNFYCLRHTHRTIADEVKDQPAANRIMGHTADDMPSVYRERISDDRLRAVTEHVRTWLFGG